MFSFQERVIKEVIKKDDEHTKQTIKDYFIKRYPKENLKFDFLDEEIVDKVIQLGIAEYQRKQALGGVLSEKNIEEAVERLEKSINDVWFSTIYSQEDEERDLRVLLSDYKRLLKENEDWQKAYQEEKDKQFELLRENQLAKEALKKQCDIADERNQLLIENQKLQKENEELKEKWDKDTHKLQNDLDIANAERIDWEKAYQEEKDKQDELALHIITLVKKVNNSIPKQKVKDKIEELKKWIYTGENAPQDFLQYRIKAKIQVLQDLLEEKEDKQ